MSFRLSNFCWYLFPSVISCAPLFLYIVFFDPLLSNRKTQIMLVWDWDSKLNSHLLFTVEADRNMCLVRTVHSWKQALVTGSWSLDCNPHDIIQKVEVRIIALNSSPWVWQRDISPSWPVVWCDLRGHSCKPSWEPTLLASQQFCEHLTLPVKLASAKNSYGVFCCP